MRRANPENDVLYLADKRNIHNLFDTYMVVVYNSGKYECQYGPYSLGEALMTAHTYDGLKHRQAVVWNEHSGKDVYTSQRDVA